MESSPLIRAHDHARAASTATRTGPADTTVAINEHTHAAGEFASAARATSSVEALRMLKLLEDHHKKLATLLNMPAQSTTQAAEDEAVEEKEKKEATEKDAAGLGDKKKDVGKDKASQKPGLQQQGRRLPAREMSSSIASNLASARGIKSRRSQPLSPSVSNDQAPGNLDAHPRRDNSQAKMQSLVDHSGKPSWVPPMPTSPESKRDSKRRVSPGSPSTQATPPAADDGGYGRFYNAFGGIINRISAPLAFAGLPLIQEESNTATLAEEPLSPEPSPSKRKSSSHTVSSHDQPDLSKIYSKATMRAISQEGHPSESFYVVPTSGHTISYANILSYAEKEKRRLGASHHSSIPGEDDDDFVDARETPVPLSPGAQRKVGRSRTERDLSNTIEELYTENKSLKDMLDKLTKRLHTFEASAQNMAESYRLMRPGSPVATTTPYKSAGADMEEFAAMKGQVERLEKDNKKMQKTLEKYREKWEALKAGAKARREAQSGGDSIEDARTA